jgi:hypothetical protein
LLPLTEGEIPPERKERERERKKKEKTLKRADPDGFVQYFHPENRRECAVSERFRCFQYNELFKREKFKQNGRLLA